MELQQGTPAWFKARQGRLTASNFGTAAGVNPYSSRKKALRIANGSEAWTGNTQACQWGTQNERNAVKDYMVRTGNVVVSKGFFTHPHYDWLGGSPDGLVGDEGMIEVKCPFIKQTPHARIPVYYYCQVNGLLEILGRNWCDFVSWTPTSMKIYRVYRDDLLWQYLLDRYTWFYAYMKRGCDKVPNMARGEREEVLRRIAESDAHTDYDFWDYAEARSQQVWEAPPSCPYSEEEEDEPSQMGLLSERIEPTALHDPTGLGHVHSGGQIQVC